MKLFTIGFTKKDAKTFFGLLIKNNVKTLIDIRLNNHSQLAGFSKGNDLDYFLKAIAGIDYFYFIQAAPEESLLKKWHVLVSHITPVVGRVVRSPTATLLKCH